MLRGVLGTIVATLLVLLIVYRRFRRNIGRQKYKPRRMLIRLVLLGLVGVGLLLAPWTSFPVMTAALVAGIALAHYGLRLTKFEHGEDGRFYTPNSYVGLAVISLFLGRLAYRVTALVALARGGEHASIFALDPGSIQFAQGTSMTLGIVFVLVGYYCCYYTGVLLRLGTPEPA